MISIIAALAGKKRVIGKKGKLPWYLPEELKRFKLLTLGHPIIMGRKTHQSIGRILPGRLNIIITKNKGYKVEGGVVVHSLKEAIHQAYKWTSLDHEDLKSSDHLGATKTNTKVPDEIFIIGGQQIFEQALPITDKLYLTCIHQEIEGDVFFPEYSVFTKRKVVGRGNEGGIEYTFEEWER